MHRQVPWLRIVAEGAVIVVSILLALGADAWWSGVELRREAREELSSVMLEIVEAQAEIERVARWHERGLTGTIALRSLVEATPLGEVTIVPDTLLAIPGLFHISDVPTDAVEAFVSSGQVGRLQNAELRRQLIAWTSFVTDVHDDEVRVRANVNELVSLLNQRVDMASAHDMAIAMFVAGPNARAPGEVRDVSVPADLAIRNGLALHVTMVRTAVLQSNALMARAAEVQSLIRGESN